MIDSGKAYWERTAKGYDLSMRLFGGPLAAMLPLVVEEVTGLGHVLELAAGTGLVTAAIAPAVHELFATDYAEAMVQKLEERGEAAGWTNVQTRVLDVYALEQVPTYDAIVASNVLHLLPDIDRALDAMLGALRPGGRLVLPTYCHSETWLAQGTSRLLGLFGFPGRRRLTGDSLVSMLTNRGLNIRRVALLPGLIPIGFVSVELAPSTLTQGTAHEL